MGRTLQVCVATAVFLGPGPAKLPPLRAESGYLKGLSKVRLVVSTLDAQPQRIIAGEEIQRKTIAMLRASLPELEMAPAAHAYVYVKIVARPGSNDSVFAVVDFRIVRPVVVLPLGRVTLAGVWEQHRVVSGSLGDFSTDSARALGGMIEQLAEDWRRDNRAAD